MEEDPYVKKQMEAQKLLDDREYTREYTENMQGRSMTYDLHGTCQFDHVIEAEKIKSDVSIDIPVLILLNDFKICTESVSSIIEID